MPEPDNTTALLDIFREALSTGQSAIQSGLSAELLKEFRDAVQSGNVATFLKNHPELTAQAFTALYQYVQNGLNADVPTGDLRDPATLKDGQYSGYANAPQPVSAEKTSAAVQALIEGAGDRNIVMNPSGGSDPAAVIEAILEQRGTAPDKRAEYRRMLAERNPDLLRQGELGEGYAIDASVLPHLYTWQPGDTLASVAVAKGTTEAALREIMIEAGVDPDAPILPGTEIIIPAGTVVTAGAETRGEGTMPQATGAPITPPPTTAPGGFDPTMPGATTGEFVPQTEEDRQREILDATDAKTLIDMLLPESASLYQRGKASDNAAFYDAAARLLDAVENNPGGNTRSDYFRQFANEGAPSTDFLMEQLRSLGQQETYTDAASSYLGEQDDAINLALALIAKRAGPYLADLYVNDNTRTAISRAMAEANMAGSNMDIVDILVQQGLL